MVGVVRLSCPYAYMVKTTRLKAVETCTSNGFTRKNRNENPKPRKWGRTIMTPAALNNGRLDMTHKELIERLATDSELAQKIISLLLKDITELQEDIYRHVVIAAELTGEIEDLKRKTP